MKKLFIVGCYISCFSALASQSQQYEILLQRAQNLDKRLGELRKTVQAARDAVSKEQHTDIGNYYDKALVGVAQKEKIATEKAIVKYQKFIDRFPNLGEERALAMMELAELFFDLDEKEPDENTPASAHLPFSRSAHLYEIILKQYPEFRYREMALYMLGICHVYAGNDKLAISPWQQMISLYPNSVLIDEVFFRLGSIYFDEKHYGEAIAAFSRILKHPEGRLYDKALYRAAWANYLSSHYKEAIEGFTAVLDFRGKDKVSNDERRSSLESESISYLALSILSHVHKDPFGIAAVEFAKKYFFELGKRSWERDVWAAIGDNLIQLSKIEGGILAYQMAIELDPMYPKNPELMVQVIKALDEERKLDEALKMREQLVERFGVSSAWVAHNQVAGEVDALILARKIVQEELLRLSTFAYERAKHLKQDGKLEQAQVLFKKAGRYFVLLIKSYPDQKDLDSIYFFLGEAAFEAGLYSDAALAYEQVTQWFWETSHRKEAYLNLMHTYEKMVSQWAAAKRIVLDFSTVSPGVFASQKGPMPDVVRRYIYFIDQVLQNNPGFEETPVLLFQSGVAYYTFGYKSEADNRFGRILKDYPLNPSARIVANLMLDEHIGKQDWDTAAKMAAEFKQADIGGDRKAFQTLEFGARFKSASAVFTLAEGLLSKGETKEARIEYLRAVEQYESLLKEFPHNEHADGILFNMGKALSKAQKARESEAVFERLFKEYPGSRYAEDAMFEAASGYERNLELNTAASSYWRFSQVFGKSERAPQSLLNAGIFYEANQDYKKAAESFELFARKYPGREEELEALLRASRLYGKASEPESQVRVLSNFIQAYRQNKKYAPQVVQAYNELGVLYGHLASQATRPENKKALLASQQKAFGDSIALYKQGTEAKDASYYAARSEFALLEESFHAYNAMKISGKTGKEQTAQLTGKTTQLANLKNRYEDVIKTYAEPEWSVASLYQIGTLYEGLFHTILEAPCPNDVASIDEEACDEYRNLLEDKAFVLEEKALETFKLAYEKGNVNVASQPWALKAGQALNRLRPNEYPVVEQPEGITTEGAQDLVKVQP